MSDKKSAKSFPFEILTQIKCSSKNRCL